MQQISLDAVETVSAAGEVIAARTPIIGMAMVFPMAGDHAELSLMLPEKLAAFSQAGFATIASCWTAQATWFKHFMSLNGRGLTPLTMMEFGDTVLEMTVEACEGAAQLGAAALGPIHRGATGNARRLARH